ERLVWLHRLADQIKSGVWCFKNRHENWRCLSASERSINGYTGLGLSRRRALSLAVICKGASMTASEEKFTRQRLLDVQTLTPSLFTLRTSRDPGFRFNAGQFA